MESKMTRNRRFLRFAGRVIVSAIAAVLSGAVLLQAYFAVFSPSSFGRFAEFPVIVFYSSCIVGVIYVVILIPAFNAVHRRHRSPPLGLLASVGAIGGIVLMVAIILITDWPGQRADTKLAYLAAGAVTGTVALVTYARLTKPAEI